MWNTKWKKKTTSQCILADFATARASLLAAERIWIPMGRCGSRLLTAEAMTAIQAVVSGPIWWGSVHGTSCMFSRIMPSCEINQSQQQVNHTYRGTILHYFHYYFGYLIWSKNSCCLASESSYSFFTSPFKKAGPTPGPEAFFTSRLDLQSIQIYGGANSGATFYH